MSNLTEKYPALKTIMERCSVRNYTSARVPEEMIDMLLRAAMAAPTAGNKQAWAFIVLTDKSLIENLVENLPYAKMATKAPLTILIAGDLSKGYPGTEAELWIQDCSAATENLLLAAQAMGLGAVWTAVYPVADRVAHVRNVLQLPQHIIPLNLIPIGFPEGNALPKDKWNISNIHRNRWIATND